MGKRVVTIKPVRGMKVRCPRTGDRLPEQGKRVEMNVYWSRRISEGCVEIIEDTPRKLGGAKK